MRADAARNLDAVVTTAARLLADDPATSIATIATTAGVDRRTVYRRFPNREALLCGVFQAKLTAVDDVITQSRLSEAPVAVALHRLVEGVVAVVRQFPVANEQMSCSSSVYERHLEQRERIEAFLRRAADDGMIRDDLPDGLAWTLLHDIIRMVAQRLPDLDRGRAADLAVELLLGGIGARD